MGILDGKVALVTGAAVGIGHETALELARQGATVIATDVDETKLSENVARAKSSRVSPLKLDVSSESDWKRVIAVVGSQHGKLDVLVNNAGIMLSKPFMQTTIADFRKTMAVNLESVVNGAHAAFPLLEKAAQASPAGASMINVSSIFGQIAGDQYSAYSASKGAVRMLTKALAVEFGHARIRVNSVHPGGVKTALGFSGLEEAVRKGAFPDLETALRVVGQVTPLGRMGEVNDIAGVIAFLASDASRFMTGSEVTIDGGVSIT